MYLHITIFVGILRSCRVCHPYTIHVWDVWGRHIRVTRGRKTTSNKKLQRYAQSGAFTQQSCYWGYAILIQNNLLPRSVVYNINLYISCWVSPCIDLVLEIPNDAYTTLSQNLIGCSTLSQKCCEPDWLILENNEKATLNIHMPYCSLHLTTCQYFIP